MARGWARRAVPVGEALQRVARAIGMEGPLQAIEILRVWPRAVGRPIAAHARPVRLRGGRLLVHVTDSAWLHQLSLMRREIVRTVNEHLGVPAVRELTLRIGSVEDAGRGEARQPGGPVAPPGNDLGSASRPAAAEPGDPALREAMGAVRDLPFGEVVRRILRRQAALGRRK